VIKRIKLSNCN